MKRFILFVLPLVIILSGCSGTEKREQDHQDFHGESGAREAVVYIGSKYKGKGLYLISDAFKYLKEDKIILNDFKGDIEWVFYAVNGYKRNIFLLSEDPVLNVDSMKVYDKKGKLLKSEMNERIFESWTAGFRLVQVPCKFPKKGGHINKHCKFGRHYFKLKLPIPKESGLINIKFSFRILYYVTGEASFYQKDIGFNLIINNGYKFL